MRLSLICLRVKIEKDYTIYNDKCVFNREKTLRESIDLANNRLDVKLLNTIISNALIID